MYICCESNKLIQKKITPPPGKQIKYPSDPMVMHSTDLLFEFHTLLHV